MYGLSLLTPIAQLRRGCFPQVDCWGVGVVMHILLGGYTPFAASRPEKLFRLIKRGRVNFVEVIYSSRHN